MQKIKDEIMGLVEDYHQAHQHGTPESKIAVTRALREALDEALGMQSHAVQSAAASADRIMMRCLFPEPDAVTREQLTAIIEGMSVSVDVSTGDHDAGHRYFGTVTELMEDACDKHGLTLLVQDAKPNFEPQAVEAQAPTGNWINADDVSRLVRDLDVALHGEDEAAPQASLCDVVGLVKEAAQRLGRPILAAQAAPAVVAARASLADIWERSASDQAGNRDGAGEDYNQGVVEGMRICAADLRAALAATPALPATEDSSAGEQAEPNRMLKCRDLNDQDMDLIVSWMAQQERGEIGFTVFADKIIQTFARTTQAEVQAEPFGYVNVYTGQFFHDVEPCRKNNGGHWRTVYTAPQAQPADAMDAETIKKAARYDWLHAQGAIMDGSGHPNYWRCMAVLGGAFSGGVRAEDIIDAAMAAAQEGGKA